MGKRTNIMLCQPFEEKRLQRWNVPEVIVQPKLDGERCRAFWNHERQQWVLVSSEENEFVHLPHLNAELLELEVPKDLHLDGELYLHGANFSEIHSIASRKTNPHVDFLSLEYHVFDTISARPQGERITDLWNQIDFGSCIKVVPSMTCLATAEDILLRMNSFTAWGYEGIIIRHPGAPYEVRRSPYIMKFKPRRRDVYRIVGTQEEVSTHGEPKGVLGALLCTSDEETIFGVGSGFTRDARRLLWRNRDSLVGKYVEVLYQALTPAHVPRFPVFRALVRGERDE